MTIILEHEEFRNSGNDATIVIERYADKFCEPLWRYYAKYDCGYIPAKYVSGLLRKPRKSVLRNRF